MTYDLATVTAPRLTGAALASLVALLEHPVTSPFAIQEFIRRAGIGRFRAAVIEGAPCVAPPLLREATSPARSHEAATADLHALASAARREVPFETIARYVRAYREGTSDPERVALALLAALERVEADPVPLRAIASFHADALLTQARESAERHRRGAARSPLDGVPVAIKEEFDVSGYATTLGTSFLNTRAQKDATLVARLRAAGAIVYGKANMHEIGIDVTGFNQAHGTTRNPYDPQRYPGGSSSGAAAAVAAGLGPVALGADGGGSIRIPAALCGVVGLKPTWSRVSEAGAFPLCWSVGHAGPIGATALDVAIAYATIAGADPADSNTLGQPRVHLEEFENHSLSGIRLGIFHPWFEHAEPEVVRTCRALVERLEARGAQVVAIELPDLELARVAHGVTILSEMARALEAWDPENRRELSLATRMMLAIGRALTARDYLRAQQVRRACFQSFECAFARCDAIVTPATGRVAPPIRSDVMPRGETDLATTSALMRFAFPPNLTGHPAITFPAGYDAAGLPIGVQAIARPWEEHVLLRLAAVAELEVPRRAPRVQCRLLG